MAVFCEEFCHADTVAGSNLEEVHFCFVLFCFCFFYFHCSGRYQISVDTPCCFEEEKKMQHVEDGSWVMHTERQRGGGERESKRKETKHV